MVFGICSRTASLPVHVNTFCSHEHLADSFIFLKQSRPWVKFFLGSSPATDTRDRQCFEVYLFNCWLYCVYQTCSSNEVCSFNNQLWSISIILWSRVFLLHLTSKLRTIDLSRAVLVPPLSSLSSLQADLTEIGVRRFLISRVATSEWSQWTQDDETTLSIITASPANSPQLDTADFYCFNEKSHTCLSSQGSNWALMRKYEICPSFSKIASLLEALRRFVNWVLGKSKLPGLTLIFLSPSLSEYQFYKILNIKLISDMTFSKSGQKP